MAVSDLLLMDWAVEEPLQSVIQPESRATARE